LVRRGLAEEIYGGGGARLTGPGIANAEEIIKIEVELTPKKVHNGAL
jgi:hypothetical protein